MCAVARVFSVFRPHTHRCRRLSLHSVRPLLTHPTAAAAGPAGPIDQPPHLIVTNVYTNVETHVYAHVYTHVCTHVYTHTSAKLRGHTTMPIGTRTAGHAVSSGGTMRRVIVEPSSLESRGLEPSCFELSSFECGEACSEAVMLRGTLRQVLA